MNVHTTSTISAKDATVKREWLLIDATDLPLGRLASAAAFRLKGKHKAIYTSHVDTGDYIIIINADKVIATGRKMQNKLLHRHTGFPGGIRTKTLQQQIEQDASKAIERSIRGMLPKTPLGRAMIKKLKVYNGSEHTHSAQQPKTIKIDE